ncbi:MAG: glycosyltransferase [Planctomycetota bacterium]|nr:MAG: glycosyltransferase [Planctomycetota bacterium]
MLEKVDFGSRRIDAYRGVAPAELLDQLTAASADLRGVRVLHVNATPYGGGVSELLRSTVPLLNDLGLVAEWKIIRGDDTFFDATKAIHNALQGDPAALTQEQRTAYLDASEQNARLLTEEYDVVFVHDPQPVPIPSIRGRGESRWVWRCHIDTSQPNSDVWGLVRGLLGEYDAAVFTMEQFAPPDFPISRVELIPPAIDPLSPKNLELPEGMARQILDWIGVPADQPLVTQVARFDPWKDPLGVIEAYRLAREQVPDLQLALVGSMALDDPEGWEVYRRIETVADADPQIHVFTNLTGVGNIEVNAFQRLSEVVIQKSIREGFGLVVSEAMWKGTPVVAGRAGGTPLQVADGVGGVLVDDVEGCAAAMIKLLNDEGRRRSLGDAGRARVREHFLLPRLLLNEVMLIRDLVEARPISRSQEWFESRDPVCGMAIAARAAAPTAQHRERTYRFCSETCRERFRRDPARYVAQFEVS